MHVDNVMLDHPAWTMPVGGSAVRVARTPTATFALAWSRSDDGWRPDLESIDGRDRTPGWDSADPELLQGPTELVGPLRTAGVVARWRNPDLWDALATAVLRQTIREPGARQIYRTLSAVHGEQVLTKAGPARLFPGPHAVLALPAHEFARLGQQRAARPLHAVAASFLKHSRRWAEFDDPSELLSELKQVPFIGPWTAAAAVADLTGDFGVYPCNDAALRAAAGRLAPLYGWPVRERAFGSAWRALAGTRRCEWTLLTLAFGLRHQGCVNPHCAAVRCGSGNRYPSGAATT